MPHDSAPDDPEVPIVIEDAPPFLAKLLNGLSPSPVLFALLTQLVKVKEEEAARQVLIEVLSSRYLTLEEELALLQQIRHTMEQMIDQQSVPIETRPPH